MDKTLVILLLGLASLYTASALEVSVLGPSEGHLLKPGKNLDLICHFDMGLQVILDYKVHWVHMPSAPNANSVTLTDQQTLQPNIPKDRYDVDVQYKGDHTNITMSLRNAVSSMDGNYTCRAIAVKGGEVIEKKVMVVVPSDPTEVMLNFDGEEVNDEDAVPAQREEGEYGVSCSTKGFHPPGSLQLLLNGKPVETATEVSLDAASSQAAEAQRSKASIQMKKLELPAGEALLSCEARAGFEGAKKKVASMRVKIIALEPKISCNTNSSGVPGDKYVRITCYVNHERVEVDYYRFEIGSNTGNFVTQNDKSEKFDVLLVKKKSDTVDEVTLVIYEAADWHFDTYYHLDVFLTNGQKFSAKVKLLRRNTAGGASKPVAYALCLLLSVLVWSL